MGLSIIFVIPWPVETVDKHQFYTSQNALKLAHSNVEFQKKIPKGNIPACPASRAGEGAVREKGKEGREREREKDKERIGEGAEGEWGAHPLFSA